MDFSIKLYQIISFFKEAYLQICVNIIPTVPYYPTHYPLNPINNSDYPLHPFRRSSFRSRPLALSGHFRPEGSKDRIHDQALLLVIFDIVFILFACCQCIVISVWICILCMCMYVCVYRYMYV